MAGKGNHKKGEGPPPVVFKEEIPGPLRTDLSVPRPAKFEQSIADEVVKLIRSCGLSYTQIEAMDGMPSRRTIGRWRDENPSFHEACSKARVLGIDAMLEDGLAILDDSSGDIVERLAYNGGTPKAEINGTHINRARQQWEGRKWLAGKLSEKYSDKQKIELSGSVDVLEKLAAGRRRVAELKKANG